MFTAEQRAGLALGLVQPSGSSASRKPLPVSDDLEEGLWFLTTWVKRYAIVVVACFESKTLVYNVSWKGKHNNRVRKSYQSTTILFQDVHKPCKCLYWNQWSIRTITEVCQNYLNMGVHLGLIWPFILCMYVHYMCAIVTVGWQFLQGTWGYGEGGGVCGWTRPLLYFDPSDAADIAAVFWRPSKSLSVRVGQYGRYT